MTAFEIALSELNGEVEAFAGVALRIEGALSAGDEQKEIEEQVERIADFVDRLSSANVVLQSLEGEAPGSAQFLLSEDAAQQLEELLAAIGDLEEGIDSLEARIADVATNVEGWTEEQSERREALVAAVAESREELEKAFQNLIESVEETRDDVLDDARQRIAATATAVAELIQEQFEDRANEVVESSSEALQEAVKQLAADLEEAAQNLADQTETALTGLQEHAADGVRRAIEEEAAALVDSAVDALAREAIESVGVSQVSAMATSALSPILPQLIAIRVVVNAIKHALEVMRLGL